MRPPRPGCHFANCGERFFVTTLDPCVNATSLSPQILPAGAEHLSAIAELAGVIWRACYPGIISHAQIEYMLARMYALEVLRDELRSQGIRYDRMLVEDGLVGFAAYGPTGAPGVVKLHKLYLRSEFHGRGLGSRLLQHVEREVRRSGARQLVLSVNRRNVKGIAAYRLNGFVITESVVTDIGGGFVMDDYVLAKDLTEVRS